MSSCQLAPRGLRARTRQLHVNLPPAACRARGQPHHGPCAIGQVVPKRETTAVPPFNQGSEKGEVRTLAELNDHSSESIKRLNCRAFFTVGFLVVFSGFSAGGLELVPVVPACCVSMMGCAISIADSTSSLTARGSPWTALASVDISVLSGGVDGLCNVHSLLSGVRGSHFHRGARLLRAAPERDRVRIQYARLQVLLGA